VQFDILDGVKVSDSATARLLLISGAWMLLASAPFAGFSAPIRTSREACAPMASVKTIQSQTQASSSAGSTAPPSQTPPSSSAQSASVQQAPAPAGHESLPIVIVDPGHGGADAGARGPLGLLEKDLTLVLGSALRGECEREGFHVILTRDGDQDPSFDDRAAIANAHHSAIFISLHVSSTGPPGTVRTYVYPALAAAEQGAAASMADTGGPPAIVAGTTGYGLVTWDRAQQPFVADSRKLGDLIQVELSQKFSESPELSVAVPVRDLHSIAAPAAAVEISSVDVPDAQAVRQMIPVAAAAIARGISGFGRAAVGAGH
jgi:N-acetylmuramoyl-L-alanine amidase